MPTELERIIARQREREVAKATPHHLRPRPDHDAIARELVADLCAEHIRRAEEAGLTVEEYLRRRNDRATEAWNRSGRNSTGLQG